MSTEPEPDRIARAITRFVEDPVTNLVKGMSLLVIGLSEASKTFTEDLAHGQVRVGHGLVIIGFFGILGALPNLIGAIEAGQRYFELRDRKGESEHKPGSGSESGEDQNGSAQPR